MGGGGRERGRGEKGRLGRRNEGEELVGTWRDTRKIVGRKRGKGIGRE